MSFLLNRDTCIAWILDNQSVRVHWIQHPNDVCVAAPTVTALALWLLRPRMPIRYQVGYYTMMQQVRTVNLDRNLAERAALVASHSSRSGRRLAPIDMMVVATALEGALTLVTHHVKRFAHIPAWRSLTGWCRDA